MTRLPPVPRWSPSTDREVRAATGDRVRLLTDADTAALAALSARAPVSNVFVDSLLEAGRLAGPRGGAAGTLFLGIDDDAPGAGAVAVPFTVQGAEPGPHRRAPELGEHSREVLAGLGYSDEQIDALVERGVTGGPTT